MQPRISINIITRDRANLLERALASVRSQEGVIWELVVVNDGSMDATAELLEQECRVDSRIRVLTHTDPQGRVKSRQEALLASRGDYVALLDDDDEWTDPSKLAQQLACFVKDPSLVICGASMVGVGTAEQGVRRMSRAVSDASIRATMLLRNNFFTSTVMFSRTAALAVGGFRTQGPDVAEDYDLWLRLGRRGTMYNMKQVVARYQLPEYSASHVRQFLRKQQSLVREHACEYPHAWIARSVLWLRLVLNRMF